jgi:hypothetical protein
MGGQIILLPVFCAIISSPPVLAKEFEFSLHPSGHEKCPVQGFLHPATFRAPYNKEPGIFSIELRQEQNGRCHYKKTTLSVTISLI